MKLYYSKGACSLAVRIIIHELNLKAEFISVDLHSKKTEHHLDYNQINRKGSVAALQLDNGEVLTENVAIMQYLADTNNATHLLAPTKDWKRYRTLEWLNYLTTEIHKGFSPFFNPNYPQEFRQTVMLPTLERKFQLIENHLKNNVYLMGENFTLPDAYLFVMLRWVVPVAKISFEKFPNLNRYFEALKKREAIQLSLKEENLA